MLFDRELFLCKANVYLSGFDFSLFFEILTEWESCPMLSSCFSIWKSFLPRESTLENSLHVLSFNVRGLLTSSFNFDILILLETGLMDFSFCRQASLAISQHHLNLSHYFEQQSGTRNGISSDELYAEIILQSFPILDN
jgi:hypothetical protein